MNIFSAPFFSKKNQAHKQTIGPPIALPDVQVTSPSEPSPTSPKRRKRLAIVPPPSDVSRLQKCLEERVSPPSSASSGTSPRPRSPSCSSLSVSEKRLRRSSTRSLELLRTAQEQGHLPNWDNLPPSPLFVDSPLTRGLMQWGTEAGGAPEKEQRLRIAKDMVRVSQDKKSTLILRDAPLITELPAGLGKLHSLKHMELHHLGIKTLPDLSELVQLEVLIIKHCPALRTVPLGLNKKAHGLRVELEELPQLRHGMRRLAAVEVSKRGRPWQEPPPDELGMMPEASPKARQSPRRP
jgi:hypothetical protein